MKSLIKISFVIILMLVVSVNAISQIEKSDLKILYVGTNPDKPLSKRDKAYALDTVRVMEMRKARSADFENFLSQYFNTVKVVYGEYYKETMSDAYDVTIIDTYLKPFAGGRSTDPKTGKMVYERQQFLTENYSAATIMIGEPSAFIGQGRQLKIDHLCLCLDAHAHGMKEKHPIFNKPFKVEMPREEVKLTGNYHARHSGRNLGESMPMWRVQTEGYRDEKGFPVGVVSGGFGFDNGIDAEWISSGTCDKGIESTAIGRHANFFHWGFAAAPEYLTESAKLAFINSIHYIAKFKGAKQITRKVKGTMLRELLREQQWTVSDQGSAAWLKYIEEGAVKQRKHKKKLQAKKDRGEKLSELEEMLLQTPDRKETRVWTIRHVPQELKEQYGENWAAYENYYKENMDYFYPIGYYDTAIDEHAKALGIANSDIKLLATAVKMLQKGDRTDMATCILKRYTNENFETAKEWSKWFKTNKKKLYFSEGDGYKYIVLP